MTITYDEEQCKQAQISWRRFTNAMVSRFVSGNKSYTVSYLTRYETCSIETEAAVVGQSDVEGDYNSNGHTRAYLLEKSIIEIGIALENTTKTLEYGDTYYGHDHKHYVEEAIEIFVREAKKLDTLMLQEAEQTNAKHQFTTHHRDYKKAISDIANNFLSMLAPDDKEIETLTDIVISHQAAQIERA